LVDGFWRADEISFERADPSMQLCPPHRPHTLSDHHRERRVKPGYPRTPVVLIIDGRRTRGSMTLDMRPDRSAGAQLLVSYGRADKPIIIHRASLSRLPDTLLCQG